MWESKYTRVLRVREQNRKCERESIQQEATLRSDGKSFSIRELEAVSNHNVLNILLHKYLYFKQIAYNKIVLKFICINAYQQTNANTHITI